MLPRYVTSLFSGFLKKNSRSWQIKGRHVHSTSKYWKKKEDDSPKITKPGNCAELPKPILEASCINAIVIGGTEGFGFAAADHLLCKGANTVVLADEDVAEGLRAAQKLRDFHGKNRVHYIEYDIRNSGQAVAGLKAALCKVKTIHVVFNDLDKKRAPIKCDQPKESENNVTKGIRAGMEILAKNKGGSGGIVINCASIFGFMGWPHDPCPVYCIKEPAIEATKDFARKYNSEDTGVRLVALCPTCKQFSDIGLPDFPDFIPNKHTDKLPDCVPATKYHIGTAVCHVMAWAENGSAWLVDPAVSVRRVPRLIHFPEKEGQKVDPEVYETQTCAVKIDPACVDTSKACVPPKKGTCVTGSSKKK